MKIPYEYWTGNNFGDKLNPVIFKYFTGLDIVKSDSRLAEVIGIGSILDGLLTDEALVSVGNSPLNVFSSGFGFDKNGVLKRKLKVFAVRGHKTLEKLKMLNNVEFVYGNQVVLGDGGLLTSYLIGDKTVDKIYDLGICPHYADKNNPIFLQIKNDFPGNVLILDPTKNPIDFLLDLLKCKAVISTAMHPLIACDSLRIPNMWVRISETTTTRFKFYDYYSVFGITKEPFNLNNGFGKEDLNNLYQEYNITDSQILTIQQKLICVLQDIKDVLLKDLVNIKKRYKRYKILKFCCFFIPIKSVRKRVKNKFNL